MKPRPDAFDLGPRVKTDRFNERVASSTKRRYRHHLVHFPEDGGAPFILTKRVDGRVKARLGEIRSCQRCGGDYFWSSGARVDQRFCSWACSGRNTQEVKHARSVARGGPKKDTLDRWFSLLVRNEGRCRHCGSAERLQCAHIVSRRYLSVRYSFDNAMCLCAGCHMKFTHRPLEWEAYVIEQMGEDAYRDLKLRAMRANGPLDRQATAEALYGKARELGLSLKGGVQGHRGWTGLTETQDPAAVIESLRRTE